MTVASLALGLLLAMMSNAPMGKKSCDPVGAGGLPVCGAPPAGMVLIPEGEFHYGPDKSRVTRSLGAYYMDAREVSAGDFRECVKAGACSYSGGDGVYHTYDRKRDSHPINYVNWDEAVAYCSWKGKRLPTEEEWEKAARGTDGRSFPWGDEDPDNTRANFHKSGDSFENRRGYGTTPAGHYQREGGEETTSPYGAQDMAGNVWEWTDSWYSSRRASRVFRGGGFYNATRFLSTHRRMGRSPSQRFPDVGFRCAQSRARFALGETCTSDADCSTSRCSGGRICGPAGLPQDMAYIPAGEFLFGPEDAQETRATRAYLMDLMEVSAAEYRDCVEAGRCERRGSAEDVERGDHPVNDVSWKDASAYCSFVGKRLPSEEEWEKAARGVDGRRYPWGSDAPDCKRAVMRECGGVTAERGSRPRGKSPFGLSDMAGNVFEWTSTWASGASRYRVLRGGAFSSDSYLLNTAFRGNYLPEFRHPHFGFRCAKGL
ncbi:MAG: SUMF1/EgtB/PvdO family nonheme iron enzyme [Myxococcota bacterium]|nr:SUMF1/EgtB/PvdO family nonheme iron enzyme [Myxococcota bacterium]